jgi:hypothetical protein
MAFAFGYKFWANGWQKRVIENDVLSYYAYLPAIFIHNDLSLSFIDDTSKDRKHHFWPQKIDNGKYVIKTTMGMAVLYAPFFGLAHAYENFSGGKADGYTSPYRAAISFGALLFMLLGLIFSKKLLHLYFPPLVSGITLLTIVMATNLFHYATIEPGSTHVYNFALIALFLWLNNKWLANTSWKTTISLGLLFGLITLIRPTNALILLFPLLWKISSVNDFGRRFSLFWQSRMKVVSIIVLSITVWIPQLLYWKMQTGNYFFNSYGESFYFNNFHIIDALFGFRKGWFVYTPIMLIAVAGIFFLKNHLKDIRLSIAVFAIIFIYITFSWWCWWYGGSFGSRPMIDIYAIMAIPLAAFVNATFLYSYKARVISLSLITLFVIHGFFQSLQYFYRTIHWDSMTKEAYIDSFGCIRPSENLWKLLERPDYESAVLGKSEKTTMAPLSDYAGNKDFLSIQTNIKLESENEFFTLVQLTIPDNVNELKSRVIIRGSSKNIFPDDLFLVASIYKENTIITSAQQPLTSENRLTDFPWKFSLNCPQTDKSKMTLKVFLWSKAKKDAKLSNIEILIFSMANTQ